MSAYTSDEVQEAIAMRGLEGWQGDATGLRVQLRTRRFAVGLRLVNRIGTAAEQMNHHPDLTLTYPHVEVRLLSHDAGGVTDRDLDLAQQITELARDEGIDMQAGD